VNESPDGDGEPGGAHTSASAAPLEADIPPTRRHASADPLSDPLAFAAGPSSFPDDGPVSRAVRSFDALLGRIEQGFVFGLLALVVCVAALAAIHDRFASEHLGRWWHYIVRGGTFATAMFAAVFATQQQRHLAMDLISRRLAPRGRLVLGIALKLLTIGVVLVLFRSGLHQRDVAGGSESISLFGLRIVDADIVATISIGAAMIAVHSLIHIIIDVDYLVRGKLPPERARSGH